MPVPISSWIGSYRVIELLGSGGMGEVYLVEEQGTGVRRALKTLRSGAQDSQLWMRFVNEGRVQRELRHANIAAFHEMFLCDDRPCLVMEYVDGETLFSRIHRLGPLPVDQAIAVLAHLCAALTYLHERGVMHRDLKSANIKITSDGSVKLLDFGIAKLQRAPGMTSVGTVMGTPEYLAPEQIGQMVSDARTEIWALGLLAYEMLTGRLPFQHADETALYQAIRTVNPLPPSALNPAVPPAIDALVMKCLEKRPSRRFQTVAHVTKQLAPPLPSFDILARWHALSRNVRLAIAAVFVLFLFWIFGPSSEDSGDLQTVTVEITDGTADVYADGARVGRTPYKLRGRIGESIRLELRRAGYHDQPIQFDISERKTYSYSMQKY